VISNGAGVKQYVQLMGRGVVGIRASDGRFLWGYNRVANDVANISTPIVEANRVFVSTGYQTGSALLELERSGDGVSARERYFLDSKTLQNHHGGLVLVGDHRLTYDKVRDVMAIVQDVGFPGVALRATKAALDDAEAFAKSIRGEGEQ
jgi:hypothetical protein